MIQCFSNTNPCPDYPNARCVYYSGSNLLCTGIKTNDRLDVILAKIDAAICTHTSSTTYIQAGTGIDIDGVGTVNNPYIVSAIGGGTVTNFDADDFLPVFTTSISTPTFTPVLSFLPVAQAANRFYGGPASGGNATATFRLLVEADIPTTLSGYIQNQFAGPQSSSNWWISANGRVGGYIQINTAARLVQDSGGTLSIASTSNSAAGNDIRLKTIKFFSASSPYTAFNSASIGASVQSNQSIDIFASDTIYLHTPQLTFQEPKSASSPALNVGGAYPLKIIGTPTGDIGEWNYLELVNGWDAGHNSGGTAEGTNTRMVFSANRTTSGRTIFGSVGINVVDFTNTTYKGDLVFTTVDATINSGIPTEYLRLKYNGNIIATSLDTGATPPITTGITKTVICDSNGLLSFAVSTATILFDFYADASNVGTVETDLYSYTLAANRLSSNGEKIISKYIVKFSNAVSSNKVLKVYFAGTLIFSTPTYVGSTSSVSVDVFIIRSGASTARAYVTIMNDGGMFISSAETDVAGITFSATNIIKITGTASDVGAASGNITAKMGCISWLGAA